MSSTNHSDLLRKPGAGAYWTEWAALAKTDRRARGIVGRYYRRQEFELYRVSEDKWEQNNLARDPRHAERLEALKKDLNAWRESQGDEGKVFNEPRPLDQPETWHPDYFEERNLQTGKPRKSAEGAK